MDSESADRLVEHKRPLDQAAEDYAELVAAAVEPKPEDLPTGPPAETFRELGRRVYELADKKGIVGYGVSYAHAVGAFSVELEAVYQPFEDGDDPDLMELRSSWRYQTRPGHFYGLLDFDEYLSVADLKDDDETRRRLGLLGRSVKEVEEVVQRAQFAETVGFIDEQTRRAIQKALNDEDQRLFEVLQAEGERAPQDVQALPDAEKLEWLKSQAINALVFAKDLMKAENPPDPDVWWRELTDDLWDWYAKQLLELNLH